MARSLNQGKRGQQGGGGESGVPRLALFTVFSPVTRGT